MQGGISLEKKKINILISSEEISNRIKELGRQISKDYEGKSVYVLSLLRGSFIYTADLVRELEVPTQIGFMTTSSYGHNETSSGTVQVVHDIPDDIKGLDVLVVDDIVDSGTTMDFVMNHVKERSEEHTSELQSRQYLVCRLLLEKKKKVAL